MRNDQAEPTRSRDRKGLPFTPKQVVAVVVLLLVAIFCAQNTGRTEIQFFGGQIDSPLWVWLLAVLAVGVLVGILLPFGRHKD